MSALLRNFFAHGADHKRAGITLARTLQNFTLPPAKAAAMAGYECQAAHPGTRVDYHFFLTHAGCTVCDEQKARMERNTNMRTKEQLDALREEYRTQTYDPYAAEETAAGRTPQPFDEAFAAHLEALDAEAASPGSTETAGAPPANATNRGGKGKAKAAPKKGAAKGKATTSKPKAPKASKSRGFRPTAEDRKAINAAAAAALKAAKVEGTARCLTGNGQPYVEFLQGRALKLDADGNGSTTLQVVTAANMTGRVGTVTVTVKKGAMTAKGAKA